MTDLSWSAALAWFCLGAGVGMILIGTWRWPKRRNRRIGLPAPECQRFPAFEADKCALTRREAS